MGLHTTHFLVDMSLCLIRLLTGISLRSTRLLLGMSMVNSIFSKHKLLAELQLLDISSETLLPGTSYWPSYFF